jgi:hypothetical protein
MANRHWLALSDIDNFKQWLMSEGWTIEPTKGYYEVVRARHPKMKYPLIFYKKLDASVHCSIDERYSWVLRKYFNDKRRVKNGE